MNCIRRTDAVWSSCRCPQCTRTRRRLRKVRELPAGLPTSRADEAWAVLVRMDRDDWTPDAIASAVGVPYQTAWTYLQAVREGRVIRLSRHRAERILRHTYPTAGYVGATGSRRRVQALARIGYSLDDLVRETGIPIVSLSCLRRDDGIKRLRPDRARLVAETFDRLCLTPGTSTEATRRATLTGWAVPLAWDDIDDPDETPSGTITADTDTLDEIAITRAIDRGGVTLTTAERLEVIRRMAAAGHSDPTIAEHCGCTHRTVERVRQVNGIASRWQRSVA